MPGREIYSKTWKNRVINEVKKLKLKTKIKKTTEKKLPLHGKILNEINQIIETLNKRKKKESTTYNSVYKK